MTRLPDWRERLFAFIESRRQAAFSWGENDCCIFCADAIQVMTGEDPASHLRGTYHDQASAEAIVAEYGGMEGLATAFLGEALGPLCARQGDIALVQARPGLCLGVVEGNHVVCVGDTEQILFPLSKALKSWRVA